MNRLLMLLVALMLLTSCSALEPIETKRMNYQQQIRDWQERMKKEGWTKSLVDDVAHKSIDMIGYRFESEDHWATCGEIEKDFSGDCEDIAAWGYCTFERLGYPHPVHILGVGASLADHALLKVQMPSGEWETYETVPINTIGLEWLFYRPFAEWDVVSIY